MEKIVSTHKIANLLEGALVIPGFVLVKIVFKVQITLA